MTALPTSAGEATARAVKLVAERREPAEALGRSLADLVQDPDGFAIALRRGLAGLSDPDYLEGQRRVAPGIGALFGVRWPLLTAVDRGFRQATTGDRPTALLFLADRLFREPELEHRWFAFGKRSTNTPASVRRRCLPACGVCSRTRNRRTSTSSSFAKTPKGNMSTTAADSAAARPTKWQCKPLSIHAAESSGFLSVT